MNLNISNLESQNIHRVDDMNPSINLLSLPNSEPSHDTQSKCGKEVNNPDVSMERSDSNAGTVKSVLYNNKGVILVVLGRFILLPLIILCFLILLKKYLSSYLPLLASDPVYFFTLLLVTSTPPAVNIISIAQANGVYEDDSANIMLWSYIIAIVSLSSEIGIYMWVTDYLYNH
ncbi:putative transporter [Smittium culicis]|uniref:Putative transporter n=1 Tax=Smittium culicis TaxID=133412 RepID=A0A1R1XKZ2_9FUNG|nr:putative transporter [Smittium culicis]